MGKPPNVCGVWCKQRQQKHIVAFPATSLVHDLPDECLRHLSRFMSFIDKSTFMSTCKGAFRCGYVGVENTNTVGFMDGVRQLEFVPRLGFVLQDNPMYLGRCDKCLAITMFPSIILCRRCEPAREWCHTCNQFAYICKAQRSDPNTSCEEEELLFYVESCEYKYLGRYPRKTKPIRYQPSRRVRRARWPSS